MITTDGERRFSYSRNLRTRLKAERELQGLTQREVAARISQTLGLAGLTGTALGQYERFERHPGIDVYAAWCRALGFRLKVAFDHANSGRLQILVSEEISDAVMMLEHAPAKKRAAVVQMIKSLLDPDDED